MNIIVFNGHGGKPWDCGATGCGYQEADLTRECTSRVIAELKKYANVYRYPEDRNAFQDIENGVFKSVLNDNFPGIKFDYAFERHFNAFNGAAHGTECYVTYSESGITVEQAIMKRMGKYFTLRDNDSIFDGVKRTNFLVIQTLKNMGISGALLETCFIDNASDMAIWQANKVAIDHDIVMGIVEGFGLAEVSESSKPAPAPAPKPTPTPSTGKIEVGVSVKLKSSATHYVTGQAIPSWVKNQAHKVSQVSNDRVLLGANGGICSWVWLRDIEGAASASGTSITKGSKIKIKNGATDLNTGGRYDSWVYSSSFKVIQVSGNRVVFGNSNGAVIGATDKSNCY